MGVSLPVISASVSDDNINLGDKDSVRRRALWTLEGKPDVGAFSVEIPELDTTEVASKPFEFRMYMPLHPVHMMLITADTPQQLSHLILPALVQDLGEASAIH